MATDSPSSAPALCSPAPSGPPLKRLRKYGFAPTCWQHRFMRHLRPMGYVPTDVDEDAICMSKLFVADNGTSNVIRKWLYPGGSAYSYDEPWPPKQENS